MVLTLVRAIVLTLAGASSTTRAYRVADACEHAEYTAELEIGGAIHSARLPAMRSGCIALAVAF
jgi:hypothetical protein